MHDPFWLKGVTCEKNVIEDLEEMYWKFIKI